MADGRATSNRVARILVLEKILALAKEGLSWEEANLACYEEIKKIATEALEAEYRA